MKEIQGGFAGDANKRIQQGFQFILADFDTGFLTSAAKGILGQIKR